MNDKRYHFQLLNGRKVVADTNCTFEEIRRMGDTMATSQRHQLNVRAFNEPLNTWDHLGSFMGDRRFHNWTGDYWTINEDYKGMTPAGKESVAV